MRDQRRLGKDDGVIVRAVEQGSEGLCPERIGRLGKVRAPAIGCAARRALIRPAASGIPDRALGLGARGRAH